MSEETVSEDVAEIKVEVAVLAERVGSLQRLVKVLLALVAMSYVVDLEKATATLKMFAGG